MKKAVIAIMVAVMIIPGLCYAQKAGSFLAGFDLGLTAATGDFRSDSLSSSNGFGFGGELRYTLLNDLSFGPFIRYHRFGSEINDGSGRYSYNFSQIGIMARYNIVDVDSGKLYLVGSGGTFTPNVHLWTTDYTEDEAYESGIFYAGGIGICTNPYASTIYELEFRYNMGDAEPKSNSGSVESSNFEFFYITMKISFNSKGFKPSPRY